MNLGEGGWLVRFGVGIGYVGEYMRERVVRVLRGGA